MACVAQKSAFRAIRFMSASSTIQGDTIFRVIATTSLEPDSGICELAEANSDLFLDSGVRLYGYNVSSWSGYVRTDAQMVSAVTQCTLPPGLLVRTYKGMGETVVSVFVLASNEGSQLKLVAMDI